MSVHEICATGETKDRLKMVIDLLVDEEASSFPRRICGWFELQGDLFFAAYAPSGREYHPFPTPLGSEFAAQLAYGWVHTPKASWPKEPDTDGSVERGWRASNERCYSGELIKIQRAWIVYGK